VESESNLNVKVAQTIHLTFDKNNAVIKENGCSLSISELEICEKALNESMKNYKDHPIYTQDIADSWYYDYFINYDA